MVRVHFQRLGGIAEGRRLIAFLPGHGGQSIKRVGILRLRNEQLRQQGLRLAQTPLGKQRLRSV